MLKGGDPHPHPRRNARGQASTSVQSPQPRSVPTRLLFVEVADSLQQLLEEIPHQYPRHAQISVLRYDSAEHPGEELHDEVDPAP